MKIMQLKLCLLGIFSGVIANAQTVNIIPQPAEMKPGRGHFTINPATVLVVVNGVDNSTADFFNGYLQSFYGLKLKKANAAKANYIQFNTLETLVPGKEGAYTMNVSGTEVTVSGETASGTFYGMQTLIQLLPTSNLATKNKNLQIPQLTITDYPRFAYRGMHLDCGRHFWPVSYVKKYIDYLALHKFNTFHWHLTEDQGWRIEIKKYPKLTSVGGWRNGTIVGRYPGTGNDGKKYGGYYTQEQVKEIVKYATDRFITVIPEIEMPGHSSAAIAAYPELSCFPNEPTIKYFPKQCVWNGDSSGKQVQQTWGVFDDVFCAGEENTFRFIQDVMDEVLALFPSTYIHIGGDECPKENWKRCRRCQQRIKDLKLKDEHELQSYFIQRVEKYLNSKGRTLIGWDEILEGGLAPNAVVMSWRGEQGGIDAAKQNHDVIMTPGNPVYFDHSQTENEDSVTIGGYNPIEKVYAYEPIPRELNAEQSKHVLGAQANMWTEYMKNTKKVEYMLFPRISALSEVLWSQREKKNWDDFQRRLISQFKRYELWKVNYSKAYYDLKATVLPTADNDGILWKAESKLANDSIFYMESKGLSKPIKYSQPLLLKNSSEKRIVQIFNGAPVTTLIQKFFFNKATGKKITSLTPISEKYAGDGAFSLVNGVQNEKGFARSKEFIAYEGKDCEVVIDFGKNEAFASATIHTLRRESSWIYPPSSLEVFTSTDGSNYTSVGVTASFKETNSATGNGVMQLSFNNDYSVRYVKIVAKNYGTIPAGKPGAGHKAWLFLDEIEVN
jgi:hexosaminidase